MKTTTSFAIRLGVFTVAVTLLFAPIASAGGPLANCNSGEPYLWDTAGPIVFNPDRETSAH